MLLPQNCSLCWATQSLCDHLSLEKQKNKYYIMCLLAQQSVILDCLREMQSNKQFNCELCIVNTKQVKLISLCHWKHSNMEPLGFAQRNLCS